MESKAIYAALMQVQQGLKAPKDKNGGKYHYRSAEDILEKVKPLLQEQGLVVIMDDEIFADSVGSYIKATATLVDIATGDTIQTHAVAREDVGTKFMSPGQATGACSSYARKYSLCGLFAIDDSKDLDSLEYQNSRKTAQNGAQAHAKQNATSYNGNTANGAQDAMRAKALKALTAEKERLNLSWEEVRELAMAQFAKDTKSLTTNEICQFTNTLKEHPAESASA